MCADFAYRLWPAAAKYGSIAWIVCRCNAQSPVLSAFMNIRNIPIISIYCNHSLAVLNFSLTVTFGEG